MSKKTISGYTIMNEMEFKDKYGSFSSIVMGHNENAAAPWVTWRYFPEYDNYEYGHYFMSEDKAMKDFFERGLELTSVDLRVEYRNEMIIADIKEALSYEYFDSQIADLMADESFITKAIESWHSIDRSDDNEMLTEKLNRLIVEMKQISIGIDPEKTYTIKVTAAMDTESGYLKVKNISKDKIISIAMGVCIFEEQMEIGFDGLLKNAGAEIIHSWDDDTWQLLEKDEMFSSYDMEFCWDVPMLYDNRGNKMFEYPLDNNYDEMILYGIKNDTFHIVWEHIGQDNYYSYCMIDSTPDDMEFDTVCKFIEQHINEGNSISGTKEEVLAEIDNNLSSMDDVRYVKSSHKESEPSFIYEEMEKEITQLSNSKTEDKEF